ncbi:MAG: hypothetical protein WD379_02270 [Dehalococcoidia bacterium]
MTSQTPASQPRFPFPLQADEMVLQLCRRHWWQLWPKSILWLLFAVVPVALAAWLLSLADVLDDLGIFFWLVVAVWFAYWAVRLFLNWYRYHNDIWVVTNQRLVDSFKPTPFQLRISTADLVNVQDITVEKSGIIPSILNFGDVVCQTAATGQQFRIAGVPHPESVQLLIDKERDRERGRYS